VTAEEKPPTCPVGGGLERRQDEALENVMHSNKISKTRESVKRPERQKPLEKWKTRGLLEEVMTRL
jgi:hypothetical protein